MGAIPRTNILGETDPAQTMSCRASRMRSETSTRTRRGERTRSLSSILRGNFAGDATGRRRRAPKTAFPRGSVGTSQRRSSVNARSNQWGRPTGASARRRCFTRAWRVVIGPGKIVVGGLAGFFHEPAMSDDHTTAVVERSMIALAGDAPAEAAVEPRPAAALGATDRLPPGRETAGLIQVHTART
jgi:hypothetical protein